MRAARWPVSRLRPWAGVLIVFAIGLLALGLSSPGGVPALATSDEIVYAVMGRNIATGRGPVSNFYDARSLVAKGFPLGDVHMPGYAFALAAAFRVLGASPGAAVVPSACAFVLTGLFLFGLARRLFDQTTGIAAALLFFAFPGASSWAHLVMPEMLLVLLACAYLWVWWRATSDARALDAVLLALLLGLGATVRETFLVFLPSAVYALGRQRPPSRGRNLILFGLAFAGYALAVLAPFALARAPYPNFLSEILDLPGGGAFRGALAANALRTLAGLPRLGSHPTGWAFALLAATGFLLPLACLRGRQPLRGLAVFLLVGYGLTVLVLIGVYPLRDRSWAEGAVSLPVTWAAGVRALLFLCTPAVLLLAAALARIRALALRASVYLTVLLLFLFVGARMDAYLSADRLAAYRFDAPFSSLVLDATATLHPRTVLAEGAFLYGWQAFPVNVIWRATALPSELAALERVLPVDVVLVGEARRLELEGAVRAGLLRGGYSVVAQPRPGVYVLASAECRRRAREEASAPAR